MIRNHDQARFAAPEAVAAELKKARAAAARANRDVRWLEQLLDRRTAEHAWPATHPMNPGQETPVRNPPPAGVIAALEELDRLLLDGDVGQPYAAVANALAFGNDPSDACRQLAAELRRTADLVDWLAANTGTAGR